MAGKNDAIVIDDGIIEIPGDMLSVGFDDDGLPKTVAVKGPADDAKESQDRAVTEMARLKKERDDRAREAEEARQRAAEANERAATEAAARKKAEEDAAKNHGVAVSSHMQRMHAEESQIASGLENAKGQLKTLKDMLQRAAEAGEHSRVADITEQMGLISADLREYERGHAAIKSEIERHKRAFAATDDTRASTGATEPDAPKPPTPDEWISAQPQETQPWLKAHREYVTDEKLNRKLIRFAQDYVDDNGVHALNTSDFVAALNARFFPETKKAAPAEEDNAVATTEDDKKEPVTEAKPKAKVVASAPVGVAQNVFSSRNPNAKHVKLPPKLAQFVKESGLDPAKYALSAVADIKAGKLPANFLDPDYDHQF